MGVDNHIGVWIASQGVSVEVAYFRHDNSNFLVAENLNVGPEHFTEFSIIAPTDPALGDASGQTLGGLYILCRTGPDTAAMRRPGATGRSTSSTARCR